jgi:hypothetical protein
MELIVKTVDVWAADIQDRPGALADKLTQLADVGADLDFIISRRSPDAPGQGVVFVTPLQGDEQIEAATEVGFNILPSLHSVRVEGDNEAGIAARIARILGDAGINLRGLSAAVIDSRFILHLAVDTRDDAMNVVDILDQA